MMIDNDPIAMRKVYYDAWQKELKGLPLTPMEIIIVDIIKRHPEYHPIFTEENFEKLQTEKFALDHNPFFHLALHVTVAEQIGADRPQGIRELFSKLLKKHQDKTIAEHKMIECLAHVLVESFMKDAASSEEQYLESIRKLI
ncbi:MAG: DUF1841 family protein [Proteobacteria bacterium]|nr:DUF1841 family protein [Pseudomonadota bacterium]